MLARFLATSALSLATAVPAVAQWSISSHVAADGSLAGEPYVTGLSITSVTNHVGARLGFSVDAARTPFARFVPPEQASNPLSLTADFDALYYPTGSPRSFGLAPYAILGLGVRGSKTDPGHEVLSGSYGGGIQLQLARHFGVELETRRRVPISSTDFSEGWEYRLGLSIQLGGSRKRATAPSAPVMAPVVHREPAPAPRRGESERAASARAVVAEQTIDTADDYVGVRYVWGGARPSTGFDCSGFVQYVYRQHGIYLPRVSRDQANAGVRLPLSIEQLEPGDLMFFAGNGYRVDHVAIYVGDGRILHASKGRGAVAFDHLWSNRGTWFRNHFVAARRVILDEAYW